MFELRVLNGLHEGAALPLSGERWTLGNTVESDLQLCDGGIRKEHALLEREGDSWKLLPQEGVISLSDGENVTATQQWQPGEIYALGSVWLMLAPADAEWDTSLPMVANTAGPMPSTQTAEPAASVAPVMAKPSLFARMLPRWMQILSVSLLLLLSFTVISWVLQPGMAQPGADEMENRKPILADSVALQSVLLRKLRDRDLVNQVNVQKMAGGITLSGELNASQLAIVRRLVDMLHHDYQLDVPLKNATHLRDISLPFRIVQITAGTHANIVTDNGQRLFVGDERDGLRLSAITADSVQFSGRENIAVKW